MADSATQKSYQIGETSWEEDDVVQQGKFEKSKPMPVIKMQNNSSYTVRIISKPYRYYAKWIQTAAGKKLKLNSSLTADCPLVAADGEQPKLGRYIKVIYRNEQTHKSEAAILDCGTQIYNGIKKIQKVPAYGSDVSKFDITIEKGPKGAQPLYNVVALPPTPMSEDDIAIAKKFNLKDIDGKPNPDYFDIAERCKPLTVEVIRKILAGPSAGGKKGATAAPVADAEAGIFAEPAEEPEVEAPAAPTPAPAPVAEKKAPAATKTAPAKKGESDFLDF